MLNKGKIPINARIKGMIAESDIENDIIGLHDKPSGTVSEEDIKSVLKRYNLHDALITIGKRSSDIFGSKDPNNLGRAIYREPETGVIVSQFALAYLANIFLISGANDYKTKKYLSKKTGNLLSLCNIYNNGLPYCKLESHDDLSSFMIRMNTEQVEYQFNPQYVIARAIIIFDILIREKKIPQSIDALSNVFERETGLDIHDYLLIAMAVFAGAQQTSTVRISMFSQADIPNLRNVLTEEKVTKFFNILKADYKTFREEDAKMNFNLNPSFTKTRFNLLWVYPIIEIDDKRLGDPFVIPNSPIYIKKAFDGLYWWFHRYFESKGKQQDFRIFFGHVFEEYVGLALKKIYGEENVHPKIKYGKDGEFIDWWIERNDRIYLFEAKANQFALLSSQTGDKELIIERELKKVADAIEQVYSRIQDIPKYDELKPFRNKKIIPFIVFMDMPFISGDLYQSWIREALTKIKEEKGIVGLEDFEVFRLNIDELELFDEAVDKIELEEVFRILKSNTREDFFSVVRKAKGGGLRNRFLEEIYNNFWQETIPLQHGN